MGVGASVKNVDDESEDSYEGSSEGHGEKGIQKTPYVEEVYYDETAEEANHYDAGNGYETWYDDGNWNNERKSIFLIIK